MTWALVVVLAVTMLCVPDVSPADEPEFGLLVDAPGVEETFAYCAGCHSEEIVAQQGKTRRGWKRLFGWLVDEQEMPEIEEPDLSMILNYLTEHYSVDRPNLPQP